VRIRENLINLLQRAGLGLHKEEVDERNPHGINHQVQDVKLPPGVRDTDGSGVCVDERDDVEPETRHGEPLGAGVVGEDFGWIERLAGRPDEGEGEEEDVDERDADEAKVGVRVLQRGADDDHQHAEAADGAGAHEHLSSTSKVDEAHA